MTSSIRMAGLLKRLKGSALCDGNSESRKRLPKLFFDCLLEYTYWSNCRETGCFCREAEYIA